MLPRRWLDLRRTPLLASTILAARAAKGCFNQRQSLDAHHTQARSYLALWGVFAFAQVDEGVRNLTRTCSPVPHHKIEGLAVKMRCSLRLVKYFRSNEFCKRQPMLIPIRTVACKPPGSDPLSVLRIECAARNLCSEDGRRARGAHWVLSLAVAQSNTSKVSEAK
jgi:hypothetical protein